MPSFNRHASCQRLEPPPRLARGDPPCANFSSTVNKLCKA